MPNNQMTNYMLPITDYTFPMTNYKTDTHAIKIENKNRDNEKTYNYQLSKCTDGKKWEYHTKKAELKLNETLNNNNFRELVGHTLKNGEFSIVQEPKVYSPRAYKRQSAAQS